MPDESQEISISTAQKKSMYDTKKDVVRESFIRQEKQMTPETRVRNTLEIVDRVRNQLQSSQEARSLTPQQMAAQLSQHDLLEVIQELIELKEAVKQMGGNVPQELEEKVEQSKEILKAANEVARSRIKPDVSSTGVGIGPQMVAEYARIFNDDVSVTTGDKVNVTKSGDKIISITVPEAPTLDQFITLAQELQPKNTTVVQAEKISRFGEDLRLSALLLCQGEYKGLFSDATIVSMYNVGDKLKRFGEQGGDIVPLEEIQKKLQDPDTINELARKGDDLYLNVLLGRNAGNQFEEPTDRRGGEVKQTPYNRLRESYLKRLETSAGNEWKTEWMTAHPGEDVTSEKAYADWLVAQKGRIIGILSQFVNKQLPEEGARNIVGAISREVEGNIMSSQIDGYVDTLVKAQTNDSFKEALLKQVTASDTQTQLAQLIETLRPGSSGEELAHLPRQVRKFFEGEMGATEAGCAIKAAVLSRVLPNLDGFEGIVPLQEYHANGGHIFLVVKISGEYYKVDPNVPKDQYHLAVEKLSADNPLVVQANKQEREIPNGDNIIVSAFLNNMVMLENKISPEFKKGLLQKALEKNPSNALAWLNLAELYKNEGDTARYNQYLKQATDLGISQDVINAQNVETRLVAGYDPKASGAVTGNAFDSVIDNINHILSTYKKRDEASRSYTLDDLSLEDLNEIERDIKRINTSSSTVNDAAGLLRDLKAVETHINRQRTQEAIESQQRQARERIEDQQRQEEDRYGFIAPSLQLFGITIDERVQITRDPEKYLTERLGELTEYWANGKLPGGNSYEAYTSRMRDANRLMQWLADNIDQQQDLSAKLTEKYKENIQVNVTREDLRRLAEIQEDVQNLMMVATSLEMGKDGYKQAAEGLQRIQLSGENRIRNFGEGQVGYFCDAYNIELEKQRQLDGGWITTRRLNQAAENVQKREIDLANAGQGKYGEALKLEKIKLEKKTLDDARIQESDAIYYGKKDIGISKNLSEEETIQRIEQYLDDFMRQNGEKLIAEARKKAQERIEKLIRTHFILGRWISMARLDEAAIAAKGLPKLSTTTGVPEGDLAGRQYPWLGLGGLLRFTAYNHNQIEMFWGVEWDRMNPSDKAKLTKKQLERDPVGPWRKHIVESELAGLGFHPEKMKQEELREAIDAVFPYAYYYQSDRAVDSSWRMEQYLKYLREGNNGFGGLKELIMKPLKEKFIANGMSPEDAESKFKSIKVEDAIKRMRNNRVRIILETRKREIGTNFNKQDQEKLAKLENDLKKEPIQDEDSFIWQEAAKFAMGIDLKRVGQANSTSLDRLERWSGLIAQYMPDKALRAVREMYTTKEMATNRSILDLERGTDEKGNKIEKTVPIEEAAFSAFMIGQADFLKRIGTLAKKSSLKASSLDNVTKSEGKNLPTAHAVALYDVFNEVLSPLLLQIRHQSYKDLQQPNFGSDNTSENHSEEVKNYFIALGAEEGEAKILSGKFKDFMKSLTKTIERTDKNSLSYSLATNVRYLGTYYRTQWDEDSLMDVKDPKDNNKYIHEGYENEWLQSDGTGVRRQINDLIQDTEGMEKLTAIISRADFNNPQEVLKQIIDMSGHAGMIKGGGFQAKILYMYAGFYLKSLQLKHVYGFFGLDPRNENASLAKEYHGKAIIGRTDQELLQMFEHVLENLTQGGYEVAHQKEWEEMIKQYLSLQQWQLETKKWGRLGTLLIALIFKQFVQKEMTATMLGK